MPQTLLEQWVQRSAQTKRDVSVTDAVPVCPAAVVILAPGQDARDTASAIPDEPQAKTSRPVTHLDTRLRLLAPEKNDIAKLKRLNSLILPIPYPESFYKEIIEDEVANSLTLLAFWNDAGGEHKGQLVGAIRCRLLKDATSTSPLLYISTLVVLSPYRSLGIASSMLDALIRRGFEDYGATKVGAHVWDANTTGLEWYAKRGFLETGHEKDYYRKLDPCGARVMSKTISALDVIPS